MNEASRIAYLDAMGIDTYVSRMQLPGAALSLFRPATRRALPPQPAPAITERPPSPVREVERGSAAAPAKRGAVAVSAPTENVAVSAPRGETPVRFSVAAVVVGEILWLEELQQNPVSAGQVQLVQAMARALGAGDEKPEVSRFDWPMHNNQQLDLGESAARSALFAFVGRRLEQQGCHSVVLLGEPCRLRFAAGKLGAAAVVNTVSTAQMLAEPRLKKQAWRDLQPLRKQS